MLTIQEWKIIGITLFITFFISALVYGIICKFIARLKNKTQQRTRKQITRKYVKIDLYDYLTSKMKQEYIGQKKVIFNELVRM